MRLLKGDNMKKCIMYGHYGSSNHGCEAIIRTTVDLLRPYHFDYTVSSLNPNEDCKYGINQICKVKENHSRRESSKISFGFIKTYLALKLKNDYSAMDEYLERLAFETQKGDIALSIGGDTYCYGGATERARSNDVWRKGGLKTVLWGCSIEPELLNDAKIADDISKFDLITARESISYNALKRVNPNTVLVCDSAFWLNAESIKLPLEYNNKEFVGLNLGPLVEECESIPGIARRNYEKLIEYILSETSFNIMLIPHVVSDGNDDRTINEYFWEKYKSSNRLYVVQDATCEKIKGYIEKCRLFVGARTHATIAAYSSLVPTLVLGYSVKSIGIAKDLFETSDNYVLPIQDLKEDNDLLNSFIWLFQHETYIRNRLTMVMSEYKNRVYKGVKLIGEL